MLWVFFGACFLAHCSLERFVDDYYTAQGKMRFMESQYENLEIVNGNMRGKAGKVMTLLVINRNK